MGQIVQNFRQLDVYKKAYDLSLNIHRLTKEFPHEEKYSVVSQMRRASKGICANLAEGFMKQQFSKADFKRFLTIAMGSAIEMQVWLDYARDLEYIPGDQVCDLIDQYDHIGRMLQRFYAAI